MHGRYTSAALAVAFAALSAHAADAAAYVFTSAPDAAQGQLTLGFTFTANATFTVTSLGYFDDSGDGFITDHEVGVFAGDGADAPGALLASTTLAAGKSGVLGADDFRYQGIAPLVLTAGQSYTIAGVSPNYSDPNDAFVYGGPGTLQGFGVSSLITIGPNASRFAYDTPTLQDPGLHYGDLQIYAVNFAGPGLDATLPKTAGAVPEPAAWTMMLIGFGGLGALMRSRRRTAFAGA